MSDAEQGTGTDAGTPAQQYREIQAEDWSEDTSETTKRVVRDAERTDAEEAWNEHRATVRRLISVIKDALAGREHTDYSVDTLLLTLTEQLHEHPSLNGILDPRYPGLSADQKATFKRNRRMRRRRESPPNPTEEFAVLSAIASELDYITSIADPSQYAPIRYEPLDDRDPDEITPFGRRRISHDSTMTLDKAARDIPLASSDHQLTMAQPRRGKDSTNAACCGNLRDEHDYKIVSLHDDGRNETPMWAIPSDDDAIIQSLDRMGQTPKAYPATVYVPRMGSLPEYLPGNFEPFTFSTEVLTPELILRLAGVTKTNSNTDRRIKAALDETVRAGGGVSDLVDLLEDYAEESDATIEVVELKDDPDSESRATQEVDRVSYTMPEDTVLDEAAQQLAMLAGEGLIASPNAATNIDMKQVLSRQDHIAVLNCNYLDSGDEGLKYTIMDIWANLIYREKDHDIYGSGLPRVAIEIREIKNICPSKKSDVKYVDEIMPLRQTLFFLTTQGGSRGVMLVGSTQKLTDMYKSARSNMAIRVILNLGAEGVQELDDKHRFTDEQRRQIREFNIGQGMIIADGDKTYPINFGGARCGLGDKDRGWRDRYGVAYGARVREDDHDEWRGDYDDERYWIRVKDGVVRDVEADGEPPLHEWYVLPEDVLGLTASELLATPHAEVVDDGEDATLPLVRGAGGWGVHFDRDDYLGERAEYHDSIPEVLVRAACQARQDRLIPSDLKLQPTTTASEQRSITIRSTDAAQEERASAILARHDVPQSLHSWVVGDAAGARDRYITVLDTIATADEQITTTLRLSEKSGIPNSTLSSYLNDPDKLGRVVTHPDDHEGDSFVMSELGEVARTANWSAVVADLDVE